MVELTIPDELLNQITTAVAVHQPDLNISIFNEHIELEGCFVLNSSMGEFDTYDVKIQVSQDFPQTEPSVYETGERIPKTADRHVCPESRICCLGVWEEWLLTTSEPSFSEFLSGPLKDYFVSQSWFEVKGEWPYGERPHGTDGLVESYAEVLGVDENLEIVIAHLKTLALPVAKGHLKCPCGSNKRLRYCHRNEVNSLRAQIKPIMAKRMLSRITT